MSIGFTEILLILLLALLLFGAKRLPDLARSMGQAVREFKSGVRDLNADPADPAKPAAAPPAKDSGEAPYRAAARRSAAAAGKAPAKPKAPAKAKTTAKTPAKRSPAAKSGAKSAAPGKGAGTRKRTTT